jgi:hypothetical protein
MSSVKLSCAIAAAALAFWGCAQMRTGSDGGMAAKSADGIPLGASGPHAVQPLPDKPRLGHAISEADVAAWNIDVRTSDGQGLPPGRGSVAEGKALYEAKCTSCHGADAKGGPVYGTMVGGIGSFTTNTRVLTPGSMYPYAPIFFDYIRRPHERPGPPGRSCFRRHTFHHETRHEHRTAQSCRSAGRRQRIKATEVSDEQERSAVERRAGFSDQPLRRLASLYGRGDLQRGEREALQAGVDDRLP